MVSVSQVQISDRHNQIDTMRAIACIGLVSFHVVGSSPGSGLELPSTHWLARSNSAIVDLRMPLFSFLSGMVFNAPVGSPLLQLRKKARRLLLPMTTVGTLFWLLRDLMGYVQQPLHEIFILPFAHFWFLQATFLIMAICATGAMICGGRYKLAISIAGVTGAVLYISPYRLDLNVFSIMHSWKLAPFFAAGFFVARSRFWRQQPKQRAVGVVGLLAAVAFGFLMAWEVVVFEPEIRRVISIALGLLFCLLLYLSDPNSEWLSWIGRHSYAIYLFHVFFTAGTVMVINYLSSDTPLMIMFLVALATGLVGPALLSNILTAHPVTALFFLGIRQSKSSRVADSTAALFRN